MSTRPFTSLALLATLVASAPALAQQGQQVPLFSWRGSVDREIQIVMQDRRLDTRLIGANERNRGRVQLGSALPREDGIVNLTLADGRGTADVIQQPSRSNNYTLIVRVRDRSGGADRYRVDAYWQPLNGTSNNGRYSANTGGYGNRDGRDHDDRDDRWDGRRNGRDDRDDRWDDRGNNGRGNGRWNGGRNDNRPGLLRWSGDVDGEVQIRIQGRRVDYRNVSGQEPRGVIDDVQGRALNGDVNLQVQRRSGRGSISVVQQPTARNGYTAIISIRDPQGGYGHYDFDVSW